MGAILDNTMRQDVKVFLNKLRGSGATNMLGAGIDLQQEFGMNTATANNYLLDWMENFKADN